MPPKWANPYLKLPKPDGAVSPGFLDKNKGLILTDEKKIEMYEVVYDRDRVFGESVFGGVALSWRP